jgi:ATP-dependent helicase STH1/SNF2
LPDKFEKVIKVRMSALQSQLYEQMKKHKIIANGKDSNGYVVIF